MNQLQIENKQTKSSTIAVAMFGILNYVYIDFVGQLRGSELLALVTILIFGTLKIINQTAYLSNIMRGYTLLLLGLIVSDIYNQSQPIDFMKGWAMVIFGMLSTLFLTKQFIKNPKTIYIFLIFTFLASMVYNFSDTINLNKFSENTNFFKSKYKSTLLPTVALVTTFLWKSKKFFSIIFLLSCGFLFMKFDARSSGAGLIIAALILFMQTIKLNLQPKKIFYALILTCFLSYGFYFYYINLVLFHGFGGSNAQQLLLLENPYNPINLILKGRSEITVTIEAIKEKPLLGFGSWAKDKTGEYMRMLFVLFPQGAPNPSAIIPKHSVLLGSWLWGGLSGLLGALIIGWTMLSMFIKTFRVKFFLNPIITIYFVESFWHYFFSPIGHIRITFPFIIAILLTGIHIRDNNAKK